VEKQPDKAFDDTLGSVSEVLCNFVRGVTDIFKPKYVNLDYADLYNGLKNGGEFLFGFGEATGYDRALKAVQKAMENPLLEDLEKKGACTIIIHISSDSALQNQDIDTIVGTIKKGSGENAAIICGHTVDPSFKDKVRVFFVMTKFPSTLTVAWSFFKFFMF